MSAKNIGGLTPFDMSDEADLKTMLKDKIVGDVTPVSVLADWMAAEASSKTPGINIFYDRHYE